MSEFDLIERYFNWDDVPENVVVPVGDDAAVLDVKPTKQIVTSIDTLISGVHFPKNTPAHAIGHKALAVNLSDLAAMGAKPEWFTLALTLPDVDEKWLEGFSSGLKSLSSKYHVHLVGGDTTRGSLSISIQVIGSVDKGQALLRSGANIGDLIYVTGTLGDAAAGLQSIQNKLDPNYFSSENDKRFCEYRLNYPEPRIQESHIIRSYASSCIDVSDGLLQDLSHILKASKVGAKIDSSLVPLSSVLTNAIGRESSGGEESGLSLAVSGGDDYELLFTIPQNKELLFLKEVKKNPDYVGVSKIGTINDQLQKVTDQSGKELTSAGYNHFHG